MAADIEEALISLRRSKFRSGFHLHEKEARYVHDKGFAVIREHASGFITGRLAPANPKNDGNQTPMRNHPVFIAQHATATCCRGCLENWHNIPKVHELTSHQIDFIIDMIMAWIEQDMGSGFSREEA